jgi:hypothetical protein
VSHSFRISESASAAVRLDAAANSSGSFPAIHPITIVAATRGAADDFARTIAAERGATLGHHAAQPYAARGANRPSSRWRRTAKRQAPVIGAEAVATRAYSGAA